jgi:hypothetical protein
MSETEYKEWVLAAYDQQLADGQLPSELLSPTPAGIKAEALKICEQGLKPKDEKILRSFVGQKQDIAGYHNAIRNHNADPFRPLVNFLDDRSINTKLKNIDLLALLIDFTPRPYHPNLIIDGQPIFSTPPDDLPDTAHKLTSLTQKKPSGKIKKRIALSGLLLITFLLASYFTVHRNKHQLTGKEGCMIWSDDHYEPVDCNDKSFGTKSSPINRQLVDHFKRITRPDTLTLYAVRKVWYAKYDGRVEFFTAAGPYPLDSDRRVLPMTVHILQKYILHTAN